MSICTLVSRTASRTCTGRGQGILEYSLIMLFIVLVVFGGLILLGPELNHVFNSIHNAL